MNIKKWFQFLTKNRATDIFILIVLTIIGYRGWFKAGLLDYGDMWATPKEALLNFFSLPYIWTSFSSLGKYFPNLYVYPFKWLSGLIIYLGFDYSVSQRVVYFFPYLFFSLLSMYYFTYVLFKKRIICFFAALFFVFNTFILQVVAGGIVNTAIAYALCPLVLAFFIKGLQQKQLKNGILAGIFFSLSIVYYPPAAYLTFGAILLFFIVALLRQIIESVNSRNMKGVIKVITYLLLLVVIPVILHFYWVLPSLLVKAPTVNPAHTSIGWVDTLSYANLSHAISIYSVWWPPGSEGVQSVHPPYFIIPLLVFIGIVSGFKDRNICLLAIIAVISVFFAKGTNKPFGEVYAWFFKYFPGGSMFRTPGKFHCLTNMAYAPLLGVGIDFIANVLRNFELRKLKLPFKDHTLKPIFLVFMLCFMMYLVFPALAGEVGGTFNAHRVPKEYEIIKKFIKSQPPDFRTFWRPIKGRYAFYNQEYPLINAYHYSTHASAGSRYFLAESYNPEVFQQTKSMAKILGILNVKYCFLPLEEEHLFGKDRDFYISTFNKQEGLEPIAVGENIDAFANKYFTPRFFATTHGALIVGGKKGLFLLAALEGIDLSHWAIFFVDELKVKSKNLWGNIESVIFYDKDINDLALALLEEEYRVDLTKHVMPRSDDTAPGRWVKNIYLPEHSSDGVIAHSSKGIIYRHANVGHSFSSELSIPIPIDVREAEAYEIWLRPVKGPNRGSLSVMVSKDWQGDVTYYDDFQTNKWRHDTYARQGFKKAKVDVYSTIVSQPGKNGISELVYKIDAPSAIGSMWMEWVALYLTQNRQGKFFVSLDAKKWRQVGETLTSGGHPYRIDISDWAKGKKSFYIKYQIESSPKLGGAAIIYIKYHYRTLSTKQILKEENLKDKADSLQWIKIGTFHLDKGRHFFQIIHHPGPIGVVDQFIVVPKKIIDALRQDMARALQVKDIVIIKQPESLSFDISIPKDDSYSIAINVSNYNFSGDLSIDINGHKVKGEKLSNKNESLWIETEAVSLKKGMSNISISQPGNDKIELKQVVLYKTNRPLSSIRELFRTKEKIPVSWKMINPTKYEVELKTKKPTYLIFSEGFDSHWTLNLKEPLHSISAYSLINSFVIAQPEEIQAILEFTPQRYIYRGLWISGIGLILICCYFLFQIGNVLTKKRRQKQLQYKL